MILLLIKFMMSRNARAGMRFGVTVLWAVGAILDCILELTATTGFELAILRIISL